MQPSERRAALFVIDRHAKGRASILKGLQRSLRRLYAGIPESGFYGAEAGLVAAEAAELTRTAQQAIAGLTWQSLDNLGNPAPGGPELPSDLRGVPQDEVWIRPIKEYRYQRSMGKSDGDARRDMARRIDAIARDDATLAFREAAMDHHTKAPGVTGYRRVPRPDESESGTCGVCIAAATRVYWLTERDRKARAGNPLQRKLMPVHDGCNCMVVEVTSRKQADEVAKSLWVDLYKKTPGTRREELTRTRYKTVRHGELGELIIPKGDKFRTAKQVKKDTGRTMPDPEKDRKRLAVGEAKLAELEQRNNAGEDVAAELDYWRGRIVILRKRAA